MTQLGEGIFTPPPEPKKPDEEKNKTINIRFSVFFDGTLNNRSNIDKRLVSADANQLTEEERTSAADLKKKMSAKDLGKAQGIYKKYSGEGSYQGGYSNVAKMERYVETKKTETDVTLKVYIEGAGSRDDKSDKFFGYSLGVGKTGVKKKVKEGLHKVVLQISEENPNKKIKIKTLTLDVFGFSRGAAAARHFIHKALFNDSAVKQALIDDGYQVGTVELQFAGLYDTVSSHGLSFSNDTGTLNLDAVMHAKEVLQLCSADEHRANFSLTDIKSSATGIQVFLPGVHSDIGGGYRDGDSEDQDVYWSMGPGAEQQAQAQKQALVAAGWYAADNLTLQLSTDMEGFEEVVLHAQRSPVSNQYSRIPLHIMAAFARDNDIVIKSKLENVENIPSQLSSAEVQIKNYIGQHKTKGAFSSTIDHWLDNREGWLFELRRAYCHFSARLEIGHGPHYIDGQRRRMEYDG